MNEKAMRLLLFNLKTDADDSNLGFTTAWINALAGRCAAVDVVTMAAGRLAVADNVRVYSVGKEKGYGEARRALEFYCLLFRLLRAGRYDACFAHMMPLFAILGALPLAVWRVPVVLWYAHKSVTLRLRLAERLVWRVVTSSAQGFRLDSRKTRVIGQGVDTQIFIPVPERPVNSAFTIVSAGRITPSKGLDRLLQAAALLVGSNGDTLRLRLAGEPGVGDAPYAERLHALVQSAHLEAVVTFLGGLNHAGVAQEYQRADVMVNCSHTGSLDKAVLEAMACGLPTVTSNEAFAAMLAPWGDLLYLASDAPEALAISLRRLRDMPPAERTAIGRDLRAIVVRDHSLDRLIDQLMAVLQTGDIQPS